MNKLKIFVVIITCSLASCANKSGVSSAGAGGSAAYMPAPSFDADSAYLNIKRQVDLGPRVPNSEAHKACGDFLAAALEARGASVHIQEMTLTAYNGERLSARNIIGSYDNDNPRRILLFAHWDSRPYADNDADPASQRTPIDGADDGASGVGVLLEIARLVGLNPPGLGIDIIFFDAEDFGAPSFDNNSYHEGAWCLGSQFWARNPHIPNYKADFGILLDMVGARGATFFKEETSVTRASAVLDDVWGVARDIGFGKYFLNGRIGYITDDHQYVIAGRNIPCIDIINYAASNAHGFGDYWHTHDDNMNIISRETLSAVGQTVTEVIYRKKIPA
ncbi:MAG: M28 family peptidase [Tannerellaceae bacterium]|jgi:Zn-dependent M28 family amino/carboxypeptidase|nr:M28 family peptidase [Tannerellaceae bacterium]